MVAGRNVSHVRMERLSHVQRLAGEAFGHEQNDASASSRPFAGLTPWLWGAVGLVAAIGLGSLSF